MDHMVYEDIVVNVNKANLVELSKEYDVIHLLLCYCVKLTYIK